MTTYELTLSNTTFSFRPKVVLLWAVAIVGALLLMAAFVSAVNDSVRRGENLRAMQRSGDASVATASPSMASKKLAALSP